jgi:WhiB family transcriptional regulator, redox-sensing transcriptional regulator
MEYSAVQQTEQREATTWQDTRRRRAVGARAMEGERAVPDEPRFVLNARGQAFVADTLGIACDSPLTNAEILMIAEKIEQNLCDSMPHDSLLIQLAVVGQTPAEISRLIGMSPVMVGRQLWAIRRAPDVQSQTMAMPRAADKPELVNDEAPVVIAQPQEIVEEPVEVHPVAIEPCEPPVEQADEALPPEEVSVQQFHAAAAGSLRGGIYRALKARGVKGYGVIELARLSDLVEAALIATGASSVDRQSYRGYLQTNKPLFIDNPARSLITEVPQQIAEILMQEGEAKPVVAESVATPSVIPEQPPVRATRRRVGRTVVARTPLRSTSVVQPQVIRRPTAVEQLPLDVPIMNKLRGSVFRALHQFGAALPTSLEHDQLHTYAQQVMADKMVTPEVQAAYDTYLRTCSFARSDTELSQMVAVMPEWIAQQIMVESGAMPGAPVQPEVLIGHKELHTAERQRLAAVAAAELEAARAYLSGSDWERRQALISVGGDSHWLSLFDSWCNGVELEAIAADARHDPAMVRRQLLHMAKAAHREKPVVVEAAPSRDWVEDALCAQTDPEIFFPEKGGSTQDAKKVCEKCNVRSTCHASAEYHKEGFGVWGELSKMDRKRQLPISAR